MWYHKILVHSNINTWNHEMVGKTERTPPERAPATDIGSVRVIYGYTGYKNHHITYAGVKEYVSLLCTRVPGYISSDTGHPARNQ